MPLSSGRHSAKKPSAEFPATATVPAGVKEVEFMVKDSKRFPDTHGWGYAEFEYDDAADTFRPGNSTDKPPQANNAKCGFACHTLVTAKDYVFTAYPKR